MNMDKMMELLMNDEALEKYAKGASEAIMIAMKLEKMEEEVFFPIIATALDMWALKHDMDREEAIANLITLLAMG